MQKKPKLFQKFLYFIPILQVRRSDMGIWMGKIARFAVIFAFALMAISGAFMASTSDCADGTKYFQCSTNKPGYACLPDSTTGGNSLQNVLGPDMPAALRNKCACSNFPGYVEVNGECVKNTCNVGGKTYSNFECIANNKPKQCVWGNIVDNSSQCGCPLGQKPADNGRACIDMVGCRWTGSGHITCPPTQECKWNPADPNDAGTCVTKSGCAYHNPDCDPISEYCDTTASAAGECKKKQGCQYSNPPCAAGEICNPVSGKCEKNEIATVPIIQAPPSNSTPSAAASNAFASIKCCCLPTAAAVGLVGLASYNRMKRKENTK
jgi:hypothetical protein